VPADEGEVLARHGLEPGALSVGQVLGASGLAAPRWPPVAVALDRGDAAGGIAAPVNSGGHGRSRMIPFQRTEGLSSARGLVWTAMDWPGPLETVEEVDIETSRGPGAPVHRTTIWAVTGDGEVYVRSLNGEDGRWYQELMANPNGVLHVDGDAIPVLAVRTADTESVARATRGFKEKYADSPYLHTMIRQEIEPTTVWLDPR
jgi:hypothetical protein